MEIRCLSSKLQSEKFEKNVNFLYTFLTGISPVNITCTSMKSCMPSFEYVMEGTMSQMFDSGPSFYFMKYRK